MSFFSFNKSKSDIENSAAILKERLSLMTLQVRGEISTTVRKEIEDAVFDILRKYRYNINRTDVHMEVKNQNADKMDVAVNVNNINSNPAVP